MNRASFDTCVEHHLAPALRPGSQARLSGPALRPGQIVAADNLSSHKSSPDLELQRAQGNDLIFLPPYSPDLNPIEMAFSKLKTLIRKAAARTCHALRRKGGDVCDLFQPQECKNHFKAAGYRCD